MSTTKPETQDRDLGGGLTLLSRHLGFNSIQKFALEWSFPLDDKNNFCVRPGLVADALVELNLAREEKISQLQKLTGVGVDGRGKIAYGPHTFLHNRLIHSLRVGALHGLISRRSTNSCPCPDCQTNLLLGILGECAHDIFTCAGGDSWKGIDHQGTLFDEDEDFAGKIWRYYGDGWQRLCEKYGFDPKSAAQTMQDIVNGVGLRGEIHEIADTASYMMGDLEEIQRVCSWQKECNTQEFKDVLSAAKRPWDIWYSLVTKNGHLVVTDPVALNNFLTLRVLLWANLYQNPSRKVLEMLLRDIVYPYLVKRKQIKISELPTKDDAWLFNIVERQMGWQEGQSKDLNLLGSFPKLKAFANWNQALIFEEAKYKSGFFTLVFSVKEFQKTKSKTDKYMVFGVDGRVDTFKAVYPKHAAVIDGIAEKSMSPDLPVHVVYVPHPLMSDNLRQAWCEARARWKKKAD